MLVASFDAFSVSPTSEESPTKREETLPLTKVDGQLSWPWRNREEMKQVSGRAEIIIDICAKSGNGFSRNVWKLHADFKYGLKGK